MGQRVSCNAVTMPLAGHPSIMQRHFLGFLADGAVRRVTGLSGAKLNRVDWVGKSSDNNVCDAWKTKRWQPERNMIG